MARPSNFEIHDHASDQTVVLAIVGELDMNTVGLLASEVDQHLANGARSVKLDLGELDFMDSSGLRLFIELYDRSKQEQWKLTLVAPRSEAATMVLRATGADDALPFESDEAD